MNWVEVALRADASLSEPLADLLSEFGYQGVALEREGIPPDRWDEGILPPATHYTVRAYLPADDQLPKIKANLETALQRYAVEPPLYRDIAEEDWSEAWKLHYHPLRIGEHIVVHPVWEPAADLKPDDITISLDPGMAFGTGTHPTTQLCLQAIEATMPRSVDLLDLGCGSAILSIAAAKLGAGHIYAIDIDPVAVESAAKNITRNGNDSKIKLATGGLADVIATGRQFDYAVVNILARIIIEMCDQGLGSVIKPGGRAIFSGVITTQVKELEAALRKTGLEPTARRQMGDWMLIEAVVPTA